jgi:hypothetical protein
MRQAGRIIKIKKIGALPKSIFTAALDLNDNGEIVGESVFGYGPRLPRMVLSGRRRQG